jgi:hypothetical protein
MARMYEVKLQRNGNVIKIQIPAQTSQQAKQIAEHQYPEIKILRTYAE